MNLQSVFLRPIHFLFAIGILASLSNATVDAASPPTQQPNILWIISDDHRADSISAFNRVTRGNDDSELGYVSSPFADELARQGVLFTRAYCNSPGCSPSRTSMHFGMYPHHSGHYGFESSHQSASFSRPFFPTLMAQQGYRTAHFGKSGFSSADWHPKKFKKTTCYHESVDQKELYKHERVDWYHQQRWAKGKKLGMVDFWAMPDGSVQILTPDEGSMSEEDQVQKARIHRELDLLHPVTKSAIVIGGVSPQPTERTQDGQILGAFVDYLQHAGQVYSTPWGREITGPVQEEPLFVNLGFHFPHTPVLPSKEFRDQFAEKTYTVPKFDRAELNKLPPQLVQWFKKTNFADLPPADQQQAIRDYFAFCAMGDSLVGKAVAEFQEFSNRQNRDYLVLYVIGDHGWHLGEQGGESKFAPYDTSNHCAVIAISSNKDRYAPGTVCKKPIEFVDFAPTFLKAAGADLTDQTFAHFDGYPIEATLSGKVQRDYVLGEMNHAIGPRAYLRSDDFAFSMRVREKNGKPGEKWGHPPGKDIRWAIETPRANAEMALFDLRVDSRERNNVANDEGYSDLADWFRDKLGQIVLGDRRVECDWSQEDAFTIIDFAVGADNKKLDIPLDLIPDLAAAKNGN